MKKYVIIGNGIASIGCIDGIRSVDKDSEITVVSKENYNTYGRPLISYYLQGRTDTERMKYRPDSYYTENRVSVILGKSAVKIDKASRSVLLDDGTLLEYDALCIATGSSPFVPKFEGLENVEKKFSFMTLDDTLALESAISENSSVLIVGAGLIGLKCAEGLSKRVTALTVCDLAPRVLSSILDDECASLMQKRLEDNGIKFMLSDTAVSFEKGLAYMKSGKDVSFDVLVLAVGVRPNTVLASNIGALTDRGILIDNNMRTSVQDIYAVGDCSQGYDFSSGEKKVLAILPNAYMQGECAGVNMAGIERSFDNAVAMNSIGFFGLHAMSCGVYDGEMYEEKSETGIKRLFIKNGYLCGFMLIGNTDRAGIYTSLVRNKTLLSELDFELIKKNPSLAAFCADFRRKSLGGVV